MLNFKYYKWLGRFWKRFACTKIWPRHKIIRRASCGRPYFHGITDIPWSVSHIVPCFHWLFCDVEIPWRLWIVAGRVCKLISPYNLSSTKGSLAYSADWLPTTHLALVLFAYYLSSLLCTVLFRKVRFRCRQFLFPIFMHSRKRRWSNEIFYLIHPCIMHIYVYYEDCTRKSGYEK